MKKDQSDLALLILRLSMGGLMLTHGIPKLKLLSAETLEFINPIGVGQWPTLILAIIAEVICPIMVILGIKTKWASVPTIIAMAVAAFLVHANDPFAHKEKALLYFFGFLVIFFVGSGKFTLPALLKK